MDVVIEGWLTKSPPDKKGLFKAKWRRRWFVLRDSGQIPGQYILEYYTDQKCSKLKGRVDLDECEQVDVGWTSKTRKCIYNHVFDIQTRKRVYYLAAECENEMNKWVNSICSVCGFKMHVEEDAEGESPATDVSVTNVTTTAPSRSPTPPASPAPSATSSAYIPISECVSGTVPVTNGFPVFRGRSVSVSGTAEAETEADDDIGRVPPPPPKGASVSAEVRSPSTDEWYDYPRRIHPPSLDAPSTSSGTSSPSLSSAGDMCPIPSTVAPVVAAGSLRKGKETSNHIASGPLMPRVNWSTYPEGDSELPPTYSMARGCKMREEVDALSSKATKPPPRPPKPAHLTEVAGDEDHDSGLYDVPASSLGVFLSKNAPASAFAYLKADTSIDDVMSPPPICTGADDMYDFPRPLQENRLNATPPAPASDVVGQWKHNYTNAPAGYLNDDDEAGADDGDTPVLDREEYLNMASTGRTSEVYTDMSSSKSHGEAVYSNVPSPTGPCPVPNAFSPEPPPVVDRGLKPKSAAPEEPPKVNRGLKPTWMATVTASRSLPPSAHVTAKGSTQEALVYANHSTATNMSRPMVTKRSFRKARKPSGTTPIPAVRTNYAANSPSGPVSLTVTTATHSDQSSSDDDNSSTEGSFKKSANDDGSVRHMQRHGPEIQYLDLDLDSEAAGGQSPKSPDRGSSHTVYKTVDFVKTKVFNEMRQSQSYRKSH